MIGKGYIDDLLRMQKGARKALNKKIASETIRMNKGGAPKVIRGYRSNVLPSVKRGYHGVPVTPTRPKVMPGRPGGYHGAPMPAPARRRVPPAAATGRHGSYRSGTAGTSGPARAMPMHGPLPPPPKVPSLFAKHGKKVAAAVAAGGLGAAVATRRGKAVDPQSGLPTGIYNR